MGTMNRLALLIFWFVSCISNQYTEEPFERDWLSVDEGIFINGVNVYGIDTGIFFKHNTPIDSGKMYLEIKRDSSVHKFNYTCLFYEGYQLTSCLGKINPEVCFFDETDITVSIGDLTLTRDVRLRDLGKRYPVSFKNKDRHTSMAFTYYGVEQSDLKNWNSVDFFSNSGLIILLFEDEKLKYIHFFSATRTMIEDYLTRHVCFHIL